MSKYKFATPSWVFPEDIKENIQFLVNKVEEIELLCFEPSLPNLEGFPIDACKWHLHLPTFIPADFYTNKEKYKNLPNVYEPDSQWVNPWISANSIEDIDFFAYVCKTIFDHCQKLNPHTAVIHLPTIRTDLVEEKLSEFIFYWKEHFPLNTLAFENIQDASFLDHKNILFSDNFSDLNLCLDVAHLLAYGQKSCIFNEELMKKVKIVHWSAPCSADDLEKLVNELGANIDDNYSNFLKITKKKNIKDQHLGLYNLESEKEFCNLIMQKLPKNVVHVLEIFNWQEIEKSIDFFNEINGFKN